MQSDVQHEKAHWTLSNQEHRNVFRYTHIRLTAISLMMAPLYSSVIVSKRAQYQHPETEAAKWNSAIIHFITPVLVQLWHGKCLQRKSPTLLSSVLLWPFNCVAIFCNWLQINMSPITSNAWCCWAPPITNYISLFCPIKKKKTTTKNSNSPPAEESMEFLTKLPESHLMVQQALMQSQFKLLYRSYSVWLNAHWLHCY